MKHTSDGSTASYYELPEGATELQDLISYRDMNGQMAEIFRACYRYGIASHSPKLRDAKKIKFYIEAEIARLEKYGDGVQQIGQRHEATPNVLEFDEDRIDRIDASHGDGEHYAEDMTDPANWRAGDWVEWTGEIDRTGLTAGKPYLLCHIDVEDDLAQVHDDEGDLRMRSPGDFRFHSRPSK